MPQPAAPAQQDTGSSRRKSAGTCLTLDGTVPYIGVQWPAGWSAWAPAGPCSPVVATACGALAPALGLSLTGASLQLRIRRFSITAL